MVTVFPADKKAVEHDIRLTLEEFYALVEAGEQDIELSKGRLVRKYGELMSPPGEDHGSIALEVGFHLKLYIQQHGGRAGVESGIILSREEATVRSPDVYFTSKERLSPSSSGFIRTIPDLAVEVVSPNDTAAEVSEKVDEYLEFGVKLIWVIYPHARKVAVYSSDGRFRTLASGQTLDGGDVLPGFSVPVDQIFSVMDR